MCVNNLCVKTTAKQVAKWLINKATAETKNGGEYLTQLKLQKLLYYAKGFFYVFENEPLFNDSMKAIRLGPVVPSIVNVIKKYESNSIKEEFVNEESIKDKSVIAFLEFIYENIASIYAAQKLVNLTHQETPWLQTKHGSLINENLVRDYFRNTYLSEKETDKWVVSRNELLSAMTKHNVKKFEKAYKELARC